MAKLTKAARDGIAATKFAFPKQRKEPLENVSHVRNAVARFNQVEDVTEAERRAAWKRIQSAVRVQGLKDATNLPIHRQLGLLAGERPSVGKTLSSVIAGENDDGVLFQSVSSADRSSAIHRRDRRAPRFPVETGGRTRLRRQGPPTASVAR